MTCHVMKAGLVLPVASTAMGRHVPKTRAQGHQKWDQPCSRSASTREHAKHAFEPDRITGSGTFRNRGPVIA